MITKRAKNKIKKILGKGYTDDVLTILKERGVVNRLGNPIQNTYVTEVLNGNRNNQDVEAAIYELVRRKKQLAKKHEQILNQ